MIEAGHAIEQVLAALTDGDCGTALVPDADVDDVWVVVGHRVQQLAEQDGAGQDGAGRLVAVLPASAITASTEPAQRALLETGLIEVIIAFGDDAADVEHVAIVFDSRRDTSPAGTIRAIDLRSVDLRSNGIGRLEQALGAKDHGEWWRTVATERLLVRRTLVHRGESSPNWLVQIPVDQDPDAYLAARYGRDDIVIEKTGEPRADLDIGELFPAADDEARRAQLHAQGWPITRVTALLAAPPTIAKSPYAATANTLFLPIASAPVSLSPPDEEATFKSVLLALDPKLVDAPFLARWLNSPLGLACRQAGMALATTPSPDPTGQPITAFRRFVDEILVPLPPLREQL